MQIKSEFRGIADSFRRAILIEPSVGSRLYMDACGRAARAVKLSFTQGWLTGELPEGVPWPDEQADENEWCKAWLPIVVSLTLANQEAMPLNPFCVFTGDDGEPHAKVDDWPRRAERFARVCDWLALGCEMYLNESSEWSGPYSPKELAKMYDRSADTIARWLKNGKIRHQKQSDKAYLVDADCLPKPAPSPQKSAEVRK